jgi:hypothetical protein
MKLQKYKLQFDFNIIYFKILNYNSKLVVFNESVLY